MKNILFIGLILSMFQLSGCGRIETGHVGVRTDFNKTIETTEVNPGWYGALFTSVDEYVVKETELEMNDLKPKAKDNLSLNDLDVSVFYVTSSGKVADLVIKYSGMSPEVNGLFFPAYTLVARYARGAIYDAVSQFDSLTIHTKRSVLEDVIKKQIQDDLNKSDPDTFNVTKVVIRQMLTDPALEKSIQQAVQIQKEIESKKQAVDLAHAEAERIRVEAEGQAKANRIIAESIDNRLIELRRIEAMQKFAGSGTHTVIMPANQSALVNIAK